MINDPIKHRPQPNVPKLPSFSLRNRDAKTALMNKKYINQYTLTKELTEIGYESYPIKTLRAPRGVTRIAGAKEYAAKFSNSPNTTKSQLRLKIVIIN